MDKLIPNSPEQLYAYVKKLQDNASHVDSVQLVDWRLQVKLDGLAHMAGNSDFYVPMKAESATTSIVGKLVSALKGGNISTDDVRALYYQIQGKTKPKTLVQQTSAQSNATMQPLLELASKRYTESATKCPDSAGVYKVAYVTARQYVRDKNWTSIEVQYVADLIDGADKACQDESMKRAASTAGVSGGTGPGLGAVVAIGLGALLLWLLV